LNSATPGLETASRQKAFSRGACFLNDRRKVGITDVHFRSLFTLYGNEKIIDRWSHLNSGWGEVVMDPKASHSGDTTRFSVVVYRLI